MCEFVTRIINYLEEYNQEVSFHTDTYVVLYDDTPIGLILNLLIRLELEGFKIKHDIDLNYPPMFKIYEEDN